MKKIFTFLFLFSFILNISFIENIFAEKNYLLTEKNYYTDNSIKKGFLDEEIKEENVNSSEGGGNTRWERFQKAIAKNLIKYNIGMTFNEYFLANNISPEDAFKLYIEKGRGGDQEVLLPSGGLLNAETNPRGRTHNGEIVDYITYVGPYKDRSAYWGDTNLESPVLFSRLSVGEKLIKNTTNSRFSNQIGYGENATINDYMMIAENNFIIPARFNEKRDDIFLTMRSAGYFGNSLRDARAFLSAQSDGKTILGQNQNPKFYLMTNSEILFTPFAYEQLGNLGKFILEDGIPAYIKNSLQNVPANAFSTVMNIGLTRAQTLSGVRDIKGGNGGQIQIIGFYRESINNDENFLISENERKADSVKTVDVKYYMYTDSRPADSTISTPLASNGKNLYSPNESVFKIETTRPYFSDFGDVNEEIFFDENIFDDKIGEKSFNIQDNGVLKNSGEKISVDKNRVRIRISEDNGQNFSTKFFTFNELKNELQKEENSGKKLTIAYTYVATDANDENIGKLPTEIADNTGAYALPFVRNIVIPSLVEVKYIDIDDENNPDFKNTSEKIFGKNGENFETNKKDFQNYELEKISCFENNTEIDCEQNFSKNDEKISGKFSDSKITIVYQYKKLGKIIVKFVNENGDEIQKQSEEKGKVGENYTVSKIDISGYEFVKLKEGEENGKFEKDEKTVIYEYKKLPETGKIIIKFLDENGQEIAPQEEKTGKIGEKYDILEKNISDYEFIKIKEGEKTGEFKENEQIIIFEYKKIEKKTKGTVFIKFLDENNNEILASKSEIGDIGMAFNFSPENISDYEFVKIFDGDSANGNFTENDQMVRFVYKKKETSPTNPTPAIPETGKIIVKYVDETGDEIETEIKEGKIGEEYSVSEKNISGYEFVKILDGDSKTGKFEEKEKIITFIYKKIENKTENSGSSPVVPVIPKDPRVTDINDNIPKIEEPKTEEKPKDNPKVEEPKKEVKNILPKDFEPVSPMGDEESLEEEKIIKTVKENVKKLPTTGPITQKEIYKKGGKKKANPKIETKLPDLRTFDLAGSGEKSLSIWLDKVHPNDRYKDKYIVLPEQGLILPINTVSKNSKEYKNFVSGKEENFESYLNKGTVELPISKRGYGQIGNKVIAGHSSYWKNSNALYKTHFQKIIGLEKGEEVWVFEKNLKTKLFERYVYKVTASYNTDDEDISILDQGKISELTLFTCTPIGGFDGRWVVKAKFLKKE